jgi:hypothetical protein
MTIVSEWTVSFWSVSWARTVTRYEPAVEYV